MKLYFNVLFVGNTFPITLVPEDGNIIMYQISLEEAKKLIAESDVESFWGHQNTLKSAVKILGDKIRPKIDRPALKLEKGRYIRYWILNNKESNKILILSPIYQEGFRPQIGVEVTEEQILGWRPILIQYVWTLK